MRFFTCHWSLETSQSHMTNSGKKHHEESEGVGPSWLPRKASVYVSPDSPLPLDLTGGISVIPLRDIPLFVISSHLVPIWIVFHHNSLAFYLIWCYKWTLEPECWHSGVRKHHCQNSRWCEKQSQRPVIDGQQREWISMSHLRLKQVQFNLNDEGKTFMWHILMLM